MKKFLSMIMALVLVLSFGVTVFATENTGSITVTNATKDQTYTVYKLFDASYDATEDSISYSIAANDQFYRAKLDAFVSQHSVPSIKITTNAEGTALCDEIPLGLYFVKQTGAVEGFAPCTPFLVTVPGKNADGYVYEVNASPKTEVARLTSITIKKVWNTDASTEAAERVTVQLLRNGNVVKTATLNAQNNWQVTYTGMPESDAYSIKEIDVPKGFTATYSKTGYVFTVTNTSTLIQTGQLIWPISVLAVGGMLFIAGGIMILQKKRKTNA